MFNFSPLYRSSVNICTGRLLRSYWTLTGIITTFVVQLLAQCNASLQLVDFFFPTWVFLDTPGLPFVLKNENIVDLRESAKESEAGVNRL